MLPCTSVQLWLANRLTQIPVDSFIGLQPHLLPDPYRTLKRDRLKEQPKLAARQLGVLWERGWVCPRSCKILYMCSGELEDASLLRGWGHISLLRGAGSLGYCQPNNSMDRGVLRGGEEVEAKSSDWYHALKWWQDLPP